LAAQEFAGREKLRLHLDEFREDVIVIGVVYAVLHVMPVLATGSP
jgi:hypothetical protein